MAETLSQSDRIFAPKVLVLADDLTGALEAGAAFAQRGLRSRVTVLKAEWKAERVLVIDTESRHLSASEAASRIATLAVERPRLVYKKTDSTLRGNIRAELGALSHAGPVLYVPAYPQLGRTLKNGCLHVHDVPVEQSAFASDPLHPVRDGNIANLLEGLSGITVCPANTEEEIEVAARGWIAEGGMAAGPSSLLHAAAKVLAPDSPPPQFPRIGRALIVSGSRHRRSGEQIAAIASRLEEWNWTVLEAPQTHQGDPLAFSSTFGRKAAQVLHSGNFDTLMVFGGDTAFSILKAMNVDTLQPVGEVLPGMPLSKLPDGMTFITKAGGFGRPELLLQLQGKLAHDTN